MKTHILAYFLLSLLIALVALPVSAAFADGSQDQRLTPGSVTGTQVIRGQFVQKKHLAELDQPLTSRGNYVVARGKGLLWQIKKPVHTLLIITPHKLIERSNGQETNRISEKQQPALRAVASVLLALFQGNTKQLSQYFNSHTTHGGDPQVLTPKTDALGRFIKRLTLSDNDHGQQIRIDRSNGDSSVIELKPTPNPRPLTPQERREFGS
jgi:hypothetical protein